MLETYFVMPQTVDRIRGSWIGPEIERYVVWLAEHGYRPRTVYRRVPLLVAFGEFAQVRGARAVADLPAHVDAFVAREVEQHRRDGRRGGDPDGRQVAKETRGPVEQMLTVALPGFDGSGRRRRQDPFAVVVPGFFDYLAGERGLRPASIKAYRHHLDRFETYLAGIGVGVKDLSAPVLDAFVAQRCAAGLAKTTVRQTCGVLHVFLDYLHRERILARDLTGSVGWPQVYRLSTVPRSISWPQVQSVLDAVDRRTPRGKRNYAILLLLVTYGLRAREIAALTLDDVDWKRDRLAVPERKAGHSTAFPLSPAVGAALVDYLQHGRPASSDRRIFLRACAPVRPIEYAAVSSVARNCLLKAGVQVARPGSHTLRHSCVQRLVDADFPLKTIGDYVGHRSMSSTEIYAKVAVESLRQVALGDGEAVLS